MPPVTFCVFERKVRDDILSGRIWVGNGHEPARDPPLSLSGTENERLEMKIMGRDGLEHFEPLALKLYNVIHGKVKLTFLNDSYLGH